MRVAGSACSIVVVAAGLLCVGSGTASSQAASPRLLEPWVRAGSELVLDSEIRLQGCEPIRLGSNSAKWIENLRAGAEQVRDRILGPLTVVRAGKVLDSPDYIEGGSYSFGHVVIQSRLGDVPTFAYILRPSQAKPNAPFVIMLHGSGTLPHQAFGYRMDGEGASVTRSDSTPFIGLGLALARGGSVVMAPIVARLPSQREGELPWLTLSLWGEILREKTGRGGPETFLIAELQAFIDYAEQNGLVGDRPVFVVGWGEGAYIASLAASVDPRIRGVVRLESPIDQKRYRNGPGLRRDASFTHVECTLSDVAQAAMLHGKPLLYAAASDDANEVLRKNYRSAAAVDSIKRIYEAFGASDKLGLDLSGKKSGALQASVRDWLNAQAGNADKDTLQLALAPLPASVTFPGGLVTERINQTGAHLGLLPSCPSILPAVSSMPENPGEAARLIYNSLGVPTPTGPQGVILSRRMIDTTRGYRLSLVEYGHGTLRWRALLAEPFGVGDHPAILSFNGVDNLDDIFVDGGHSAIPYMHGYGDELARRGFVVMVPILPSWYGDTFAAITSARSLGRSSVWKVIFDSYRNALDALETIPTVDATRVATYGISGGGILGAVFSAVDQRVEAVVFSNVPVDYQGNFNISAGVYSNLWLADACTVADAALVAIAPRTLIWEAGEDPYAENAGMDVIQRVRERYRRLGREEQFTFRRHSAGHETLPTQLRIFGR